MSDHSRGITRRDLLGGIAGGAAVAALGPRLAFGSPAKALEVETIEV